MRFIQYMFVFFLLRNPTEVIAKYLRKKNIENDLFDSTPVPSLVSNHETIAPQMMDDDLFTPSSGTSDFSIFPPEMSESDDACLRQASIDDDEGASSELSDSEALWARGLEDEDLGPFAGSNDLQCHQRRTKPKKPKKEVVPQEPSLWPLVYPEVPQGRCPDVIRHIAACCASRDGMNPFDCWACTLSLVNDTLLKLIFPKLMFGSAGAWLGISIAVGRSIR